jgi:hypothetical protein
VNHSLNIWHVRRKPYNSRQATPENKLARGTTPEAPQPELTVVGSGRLIPLMARNKGLRPINETRRSDGTLTAETARRLLCRRGGLARAAQQRADGFKMLAEMRRKSILVRTLKAASRCACHHCEAKAESMLKAWDAVNGKQDSSPLSDTDRRLL